MATDQTHWTRSVCSLGLDRITPGGAGFRPHNDATVMYSPHRPQRPRTASGARFRGNAARNVAGHRAPGSLRGAQSARGSYSHSPEVAPRKSPRKSPRRQAPAASWRPATARGYLNAPPFSPDGKSRRPSSAHPSLYARVRDPMQRAESRKAIRASIPRFSARSPSAEASARGTWSARQAPRPSKGEAMDAENLEFAMIASSMSRVVDAVGRDTLAHVSSEFRDQYTNLELITAAFSNVIHEIRRTRNGLASTLSRVCANYRRLFRRILQSVTTIKEEHQMRVIELKAEFKDRTADLEDAVLKLRKRLEIMTSASQAKNKVIQIHRDSEMRMEQEVVRMQQMVCSTLKLKAGIDLLDEGDEAPPVSYDDIAEKLTARTEALTRSVEKTLREVERAQLEKFNITNRIDGLFQLASKRDLSTAPADAEPTSAKPASKRALPSAPSQRRRPPMRTQGMQTDCRQTKYYVLVDEAMGAPVWRAAELPQEPPPPKEQRAAGSHEGDVKGSSGSDLVYSGRTVISDEFKAFLGSDASLSRYESEDVLTTKETRAKVMELCEGYLSVHQDLSLQEYVCLVCIEKRQDMKKARASVSKLLLSVLVHRGRSKYIDMFCKFLRMVQNLGRAERVVCKDSVCLHSMALLWFTKPQLLENVYGLRAPPRGSASGGVSSDLASACLRGLLGGAFCTMPGLEAFFTSCETWRAENEARGGTLDVESFVCGMTGLWELFKAERMRGILRRKGIAELLASKRLHFADWKHVISAADPETASRLPVAKAFAMLQEVHDLRRSSAAPERGPDGKLTRTSMDTLVRDVCEVLQRRGVFCFAPKATSPGPDAKDPGARDQTPTGPRPAAKRASAQKPRRPRSAKSLPPKPPAPAPTSSRRPKVVQKAAVARKPTPPPQIVPRPVSKAPVPQLRTHSLEFSGAKTTGSGRAAGSGRRSALGSARSYISSSSRASSGRKRAD